MATTQSLSSNVFARIAQLRVVPVIVIDDALDAVPLGTALTAGGLPCAEITFRTAAAAEAVRRMTAECPDMLVGAGTVLSPAQAAEARAAGAQFIVAPGFSAAVVDYCQEHGLPVFPGVCTPTDIEMALARGVTTMKFFPAEPMGGLKFLKAIAAPYGPIDFMPMGGITTTNLSAYLSFERVFACGGSWLAPRASIAERQWDRVRDAATEATAIARATLPARGNAA